MVGAVGRPPFLSAGSEIFALNLLISLNPLFVLNVLNVLFVLNVLNVLFACVSRALFLLLFSPGASCGSFWATLAG